MPSTEAVWTLSVVRVLIVPRALYETLQNAYPNEVTKILTALKGRAEKVGFRSRDGD